MSCAIKLLLECKMINTIVDLYSTTLNKLIKNKNYSCKIYNMSSAQRVDRTGNTSSEFYSNYIVVNDDEVDRQILADAKVYEHLHPIITIMFYHDQIIIHYSSKSKPHYVATRAFTYSNSIDDIAVIINDILGEHDNIHDS